MRAGRVARLREAQAFLRDRHGIAYSLNGISLLFKRHRVKLKTGPPQGGRGGAGRVQKRRSGPNWRGTGPRGPLPWIRPASG
jgi:hypothetical protein